MRLGERLLNLHRCSCLLLNYVGAYWLEEILSLDDCCHLASLVIGRIIEWLWWLLLASINQLCKVLLCLSPWEIEKNNPSEVVASWSAPLEWFLRCPNCGFDI